MRRPGFYFHQTDADPQRSKGQQAVTESDGFICAHCGRAVFVKPMADPADMGGKCSLCAGRDGLSGLICKHCAAKGTCDPFEEKLRRVEAGKMLFTDIGR
jgi:hypothetical protein